MEIAARVEGMRPFLLHEQPWVEFFFSHLNDPETIHRERFSRASLPANIKIGDEITVFYLLGAVASISAGSGHDGRDEPLRGVRDNP